MAVDIYDWKSLIWRNTNIAKLEALYNAGYTVILVLDGVKYNWKSYRIRYGLLDRC
jgi:histidinol phosphatase-like enzyme